MFQLIAAVISTSLVAAMAIVCIYYGGTAFKASTRKASVSTLVNYAQQISAAQELYVMDYGGTPATTITQLLATGPTGSYLANAPGVPELAAGNLWAITPDGAIAYLAIQSPNQALTNTINIMAGNDVPLKFGISDAAAAIGTVGTDAGASVFWFRL